MDRRNIYKKVKLVLKGGLLLFMSITIANINITNGYSAEDKDPIDVISSNSTITDIIYTTTDEVSKGPARSTGKVAYITIDDGPSKYTEDILKILDKYNAKATFFMIDRNMKVYPESVKSVLKKGNSVGLHSVTHDVRCLYKNSNSAKNEFDRNKETLYCITGDKTNLIRLPYGSKPYTSIESYKTLVNNGYNIWDWNIDTEDWRVSSEQIIKNVKRYSKNQNELILLMHEKAQTVEALEPMLKYLCDEGYELLAIDKNQSPKNFWLDNLYKD